MAVPVNRSGLIGQARSIADNWATQGFQASSAVALVITKEVRDFGTRMDLCRF